MSYQIIIKKLSNGGFTVGMWGDELFAKTADEAAEAVKLALGQESSDKASQTLKLSLSNEGHLLKSCYSAQSAPVEVPNPDDIQWHNTEEDEVVNEHPTS